MTSERQKPVVNAFKTSLLTCQAVANAILDNAIEEKMPINEKLILSIQTQLQLIQKTINYAGQIREHDLNSGSEQRSKECSIKN